MTELTKLQQINKEASKFYNYEQAVKLMLNSIYGAFGNPYFYFFNVRKNIPSTITEILNLLVVNIGSDNIVRTSE